MNLGVSITIEVVAAVAAAHSGPYAPLVYAGVKQLGNNVSGRQGDAWDLDDWSWQAFVTDSASYYASKGYGSVGAMAAKHALYEVGNEFYGKDNHELGDDWSWNEAKVAVATDIVTAGIDAGIDASGIKASGQNLSFTQVATNTAIDLTREVAVAATRREIARAVYGNDYKESPYNSGTSIFEDAFTSTVTSKLTETFSPESNPNTQPEPQTSVYGLAKEFFDGVIESYGADPVSAQINTQKEVEELTNTNELAEQSSADKQFADMQNAEHQMAAVTNDNYRQALSEENELIGSTLANLAGLDASGTSTDVNSYAEQNELDGLVDLGSNIASPSREELEYMVARDREAGFQLEHIGVDGDYTDYAPAVEYEFGVEAFRGTLDSGSQSQIGGIQNLNPFGDYQANKRSELLGNVVGLKDVAVGAVEGTFEFFTLITDTFNPLDDDRRNNAQDIVMAGVTEVVDDPYSYVMRGLD